MNNETETLKDGEYVIVTCRDERLVVLYSPFDDGVKNWGAMKIPRESVPEEYCCDRGDRFEVKDGKVINVID
tara:strand:- start:522 stop:737 length:216 start_codon:yes stop_codon:yes gene_type:complete